MACLYVPDDFCLGAVTFGNSVGGALSTATGYSAEDLCDDSIERVWLSGLAATTTFNIAIAIPSVPTNWTEVFVFGVKATDGTLPSSVAAAVGTNISGGAGWSNLGSLNMNTRGDGRLAVSAQSAAFLRIQVTFGSAKSLQVGKIGVGTSITLARTFAERSNRPAFATLVNRSGNGTPHTAALADYRQRFTLAWDALAESNRDELFALWQSARGMADAFVLVPDTADASAVHHGRLTSDEFPEEVDDPIWRGCALGFEESGRAL